MAELQASWISASSHPADTDRLVLEGLMNPPGAAASGAKYGVGSGATELQVTQNGTPNMSVNVAAGHAWIDGTENGNQGAYHVYNDATKNLVISAAHATLARKDLIVAKVQDAQYSGATNAWSLVVVTGTPAGSPAEPAVPANAIVLALVDVAALASSITNGNITDRRRRASSLGGVGVCTSTTRPTAPYEGQMMFETDTDKLITYNGVAWVEMVPAGAWTDYTPTLTQSGAVAKSVVYAKYQRIGRTINFRLKLSVTGTGTALNRINVGLPVNAADIDYPVGSAWLYDASAGAVYRAIASVDAGAATVVMAPTNSTVTDVLGVTSFTGGLDSTDVIIIAGMYEAAS